MFGKDGLIFKEALPTYCTCQTCILVTSFDALKQSTGICEHPITFSSSKYITLNKLSCFQSKHTFLGGQITSFLFKISLSRSVCVPSLFIFGRHQFRCLSLDVSQNNIFHCSPVFTGCTLYCTRKTKD